MLSQPPGGDGARPSVTPGAKWPTQLQGNELGQKTCGRDHGVHVISYAVISYAAWGRLKYKGHDTIIMPAGQVQQTLHIPVLLLEADQCSWQQL